MGLHGPMISAIDLDTRNLEALRAIPKGEHNGDTRAPLSLVELEGFLPAEMLAPEGVETNYALIHFGSIAKVSEIDPNQGPRHRRLARGFVAQEARGRA
ncbi:hypothetical protein BGZ61DRAFT_463421 [Ilyonectria robusta]|uniref:uncharacterized protein n=1 Tax=Ilyonectria robusta TaxID=1079257 RepID=UPI001E8CF552|nr:uncharacterized protein BGZ61DRAFT_463421 [Ilyonectria robusta]KAH8662801.1 hypothetical protein BGZ61DRAFT_463421 [Ilyonectria robusta]